MIFHSFANSVNQPGPAIAISSAVGVFFAVYPARRAARLDPIEALRFEG